MDSFYVYDNWTTGRSRVHRGECAYCNQGRGMARKPSSQHGRWHGPFYDLDEASAFARGLNRAEVSACSKCLADGRSRATLALPFFIGAPAFSERYISGFKRLAKLP